jgi:hypothetical protein
LLYLVVNPTTIRPWPRRCLRCTHSILKCIVLCQVDRSMSWMYCSMFSWEINKIFNIIFIDFLLVYKIYDDFKTIVQDTNTWWSLHPVTKTL